MSNKTKEKGVHAKNQEFRKYDQVRKDQNYHLVEHAELEMFDDDYRIRPVT